MGCENDKGSVAAEPESFSRRNGDALFTNFTNLRRDDNTDCCRFERGRHQLKQAITLCLVRRNPGYCPSEALA